VKIAAGGAEDDDARGTVLCGHGNPIRSDAVIVYDFSRSNAKGFVMDQTFFGIRRIKRPVAAGRGMPRAGA
jgi:hypothetical protein